MIINAVDCIESKKLPKLPVASALWIPQPNFEVGAAAWILAGGTHHTSFSYDLTVEDLLDYAEVAGIEAVVIDNKYYYPSVQKRTSMERPLLSLSKRNLIFT